MNLFFVRGVVVYRSVIKHMLKCIIALLQIDVDYALGVI